MAYTKLHLSSCIIFLLFIVLASSSLAKINLPNDKKSSAFEFLNQLKRCKKGDNIKGIQELKNYLHKFGYLDKNYQTLSSDDNNFDDALETAIKTYQLNYHVNVTGVLDDETMSKMRAPRCGVPDIINGTNFMQAKNEMHDSHSSNFHTVSHYSFFAGSPKWPITKSGLTYAFSPNTRSDSFGPVANAFDTWASASQFKFSQVQNVENADLVIGFYREDHGDGFPFDGPRGVLAHSFAPTDGRFHYDADEQWVVGAVPDAFDLQSVAVHEIGHLLGLGHSSVQEAIMYPSIATDTVKIKLQHDDILGIGALYNI